MCGGTGDQDSAGGLGWECCVLGAKESSQWRPFAPARGNTTQRLLGPSLMTGPGEMSGGAPHGIHPTTPTTADPALGPVGVWGGE